MTILEFFAASTPVMMSDIGSLSEIGRALGTEWAVTGGIGEWTTRLTSLRDDMFVDRASRVARQAYEQNYAQSSQLDQLMAVYERVAHR